MNRAALALTLIGALVGGGVGFLIATADEAEGPILVASDRPVTSAQVTETLQAQGWANIEIVEMGRYFAVTGTQMGHARKIMVNSLTGRLIDDDDD